MIRSLAPAARLLLAAAAAVALSAWSPAEPRTQPALTGTADWDGPPLPDSAEFEATLLDVTPTGRAPELIGRTRVRPIQERPLRFAIPYDPALIKYGHRYTVEARIVDGGAERFATPAPVQAFVDGQPVPIGLALQPPIAAPASPALAAPAQFAGTLPCADCAGIEYRLTLGPRDSYTLERRYLGKQGEPEFTERGYWTYDPSDRKLTLGGDPAQATAFEVLAGDRLRLLDVTGQPIVSELNYDLVRTAAGSPYAAPSDTLPAVATGGPTALAPPGTTAAPPRRIRGLYRGLPGGAEFVECGDSRGVAIAPAGQDTLLAGAYRRAQPQPGQAMLVEIDGRIGFGPRPSGDGLGRVLTVDRFVAIHPGESCAPPATAGPTAAAPANWTAPDGRPPLRETTWRLLSVGAQTVTPARDRAQPFLTLNGDLPVFSGNSGCNRIGGEFVLADQSLSFTPGPSTRMACPGTAELERAFLDGLAKAASWSITGDHLTLYGADGSALLRFSAHAPG